MSNLQDPSSGRMLRDDETQLAFKTSQMSQERRRRRRRIWPLLLVLLLLLADGDIDLTVASDLSFHLDAFRLIIAEVPRFPQLGTLFLSTVTQRGLGIMTALLREAREQQIIVDIDFDAVTHTLLGGLLTYAITSLVLAGEEAHPPALERADAVVEVIIRALTP